MLAILNNINNSEKNRQNTQVSLKSTCTVLQGSAIFFLDTRNDLIYLFSDFMGFTAKLMAERTQIGDRQSISEGEYMCHVFVRADSLIGVCLSDQEYPKMVAHKLLTKVSAK